MEFLSKLVEQCKTIFATTPNQKNRKHVSSTNLIDPRDSLPFINRNTSQTNRKVVSRADSLSIESPQFYSPQRRVFTEAAGDYFAFNEEGLPEYEAQRVKQILETCTTEEDERPRPSIKEDQSPLVVLMPHRATKIRPTFMNARGSMCITDFWADKDKKDFMKSRKDVQLVDNRFVKFAQGGHLH
eukprot:TRINITY_DN4884_c0_g2_i3.p2 TRINITY_DN4884_c0_g2~~TRINITY_DN4884_c0_g2_i3.p2  ORF type:complete len:185 (-),score=9.43 TRINITY_DN4884_c0_g2_i3:335-889(-)